MHSIYLDHNASTRLRREVKETMIKLMDHVGNASSIHGYGRTYRQHLEASRQKIADFMGVKSSQVIFTSGATEANNLALKGFNGQVIVSAIEHDSVLLARPDAFICSVDAQGLIQLNHLEDLLKKASKPALVAIMAANNETGVIQPLEAIHTLCRHYDAWFHCDAVQSIGKIKQSWSRLSGTMIALSAHKIGGPSGVGALIIDEKLPLSPLIQGGGQERSYRAGSENALGIVGFGTALEACHQDDWATISHYRDFLEMSIRQIAPEVAIFGNSVARLPNTTNLTMPGVSSAIQLMNFDLAGIAVSAGSACSSGKVKSSHVLKAMNVQKADAESSIRISLGWSTKQEEIHRFITVWQEIYYRLGNHSERMRVA
jgi:cysteine desulfurase